jgi:NAD-dependent deacetylase
LEKTESMLSTRVVVLTGAGISAESGVRTFRDNDGLWENHRIEDVATPEAWREDPELVWQFYQARRKQLLEVEPNVIHMHGRLNTLRCEQTNRNEIRMSEDDLQNEFLSCTCCSEPSRLRPDIVWFGETPMEMPTIYAALEKCEVFIVVGSSGHVYPAAGMVNIAKMIGAKTILVNLDEPLNAYDFDESHYGKAGELLPKLLQTWMKEF